MSINKYIQILLQPVSVFLCRNAEDLHPSMTKCNGVVMLYSLQVPMSTYLLVPMEEKVYKSKLVGGFHKFDSLYFCKISPPQKKDQELSRTQEKKKEKKHKCGFHKKKMPQKKSPPFLPVGFPRGFLFI